MNNKVFDNNWKQIRSQTTAWWSLMGEFDLKKVDKSANKLDKYATMLQVKYGYSRKQAKDEVARRLAEFKAEQAKMAGEMANKNQ